jgi:2-C-methyl-D-erythritol 2,4-cyclodiphosphate synthase
MGHSDADVLSHAIADALLGAARLGDIGKLFPDTDPAYKDISSLTLLSRTAHYLQERGYKIVDIDSVVGAEAPRLSPYREQMRQNIAEALSIEIAHIGIKATTTERLGFVGREEGISAYATCLLQQI